MLKTLSCYFVYLSIVCCSFISLDSKEPKTSYSATLSEGVFFFDLIVVELELNGVKRNFILDTGSNASVFDLSLIKLFNGRVTKERKLNAFRVLEFDEKNTLGFGGITKAIDVFFLCDLSLISKISGLEISGIVGMNFLINLIVKIDFSTGVITFSDNKEYLEEILHKKKYEKSDIGYMKGLPYTLNENGEFICLLDTGATIGKWPEKVFEFYSDTVIHVGTYSVLKFKDNKVTNLVFEEEDTFKLSFTDDAGKIETHYFGKGDLSSGMQDFIQSDMIFDFIGDKYYYIKNDKVVDFNSLELSFGFYRLFDFYLVLGGNEKSPLKAGDILFEVDGVKAGNLKVWEIRKKLISKKGAVLKVLRADEIIMIHFKM